MPDFGPSFSSSTMKALPLIVTAPSSNMTSMSSLAPDSTTSVSTESPTLTVAISGTTLISAASATPSTHTNTGAIAGAAVGAAVGAAILAAIITYFLMRSRLTAKRTITDSDVPTPNRSTIVMDKGYFTDSAAQSRVVSGDWTRHLPQPADDVSIVGTMETIYQQIELHIDNFYSNAEPSSGGILENTHALLSEIDSGLVRPTLPEAMMGHRHKKTIIKHSLAHLILSNITIEDDSPGSLLPRDVSELQKSLRNATKHQTKPATSRSLAYTRVLASYLRPYPFEDQALLARRDKTIKTMATTFCMAFEPWSSRGTSSNARFTNLVEIMRGAAMGGLLLFSQRATYKFDWELKDKSVVNTLVVLPGLAKVTDDEASPLHRVFVYKPQVVSELK